MKYNFRNYFIIFITLLLTSAVFNNLKAVTENEAFLGDKEAKVTIIEYASMTCNHCADFHREIYPKIKEKYIDSKKIKFIYRDFPLDKQALYASILAKCAPEDKYFDFVKLILSTQSKWISNDDSFVEKLTNIGKLAGLNEEKITNCFSDEKLVDKIIQSRSDAEKKYGIQSTPSFIINEKKYSAMSFENFEKIIDNLIN
tara:strand:- start:2914 stop:3513 length:600 start_codon:yes stop_codon:yes gene_type:complete